MFNPINWLRGLFAARRRRANAAAYKAGIEYAERALAEDNMLSPLEFHGRLNGLEAVSRVAARLAPSPFDLGVLDVVNAHRFRLRMQQALQRK